MTQHDAVHPIQCMEQRVRRPNGVWQRACALFLCNLSGSLPPQLTFIERIRHSLSMGLDMRLL